MVDNEVSELPMAKVNKFTAGKCFSNRNDSILSKNLHPTVVPFSHGNTNSAFIKIYAYKDLCILIWFHVTLMDTSMEQHYFL